MLVEKKLYPSDYTDLELEKMHLVNFSEMDSITPFGSYSFKLPYPGDIDLFEDFSGCCNLGEVVNKFANKIKEIVQIFISMPKSEHDYIIEFKIGLDTRYDIDIGTLIETVYTPNPELMFNIDRLHKNGLLSDAEVINVENTLKNHGHDSIGYDIIFNLLREHRILRWDLDELVNGYKRLPGGKKISIEEALLIKTDLKIDIVTQINHKFIEISNFIRLILRKEDNSPGYVINLGYLFTQDNISMLFEDTIRKAIEKLFYSQIYYDYMKGVKRIFSLAYHFKDNLMLEKILPLLSSYIASLYQLRSQINAILYIMEYYDGDSPFDEFARELNAMKLQLVEYTELSDEIINELQEEIEISIILSNKKNYNAFEEQLENITKKLDGIINERTMNYLIEKEVYPIACHYLPAILSYTNHCRGIPEQYPQEFDINELKAISNAEKIKEYYGPQEEITPLTIGEIPIITHEQTEIPIEQQPAIDVRPSDLEQIIEQHGITEYPEIPNIEQPEQVEIIENQPVTDLETLQNEYQTTEQIPEEIHPEQIEQAPTYQQQPSFWKKVAKYLGYGVATAATIAAIYFGYKYLNPSMPSLPSPLRPDVENPEEKYVYMKHELLPFEIEGENLKEVVVEPKYPGFEKVPHKRKKFISHLYEDISKLEEQPFFVIPEGKPGTQKYVLEKSGPLTIPIPSYKPISNIPLGLQDLSPKDINDMLKTFDTVEILETPWSSYDLKNYAQQLEKEGDYEKSNAMETLAIRKDQVEKLYNRGEIKFTPAEPLPYEERVRLARDEMSDQEYERKLKELEFDLKEDVGDLLTQEEIEENEQRELLYNQLMEERRQQQHVPQPFEYNEEEYNEEEYPKPEREEYNEQLYPLANLSEQELYDISQLPPEEIIKLDNPKLYDSRNEAFERGEYEKSTLLGKILQKIRYSRENEEEEKLKEIFEEQKVDEEIQKELEKGLIEEGVYQPPPKLQLTEEQKLELMKQRPLYIPQYQKPTESFKQYVKQVTKKPTKKTTKKSTKKKTTKKKNKK